MQRAWRVFVHEKESLGLLSLLQRKYCRNAKIFVHFNISSLKKKSMWWDIKTRRCWKCRILYAQSEVYSQLKLERDFKSWRSLQLVSNTLCGAHMQTLFDLICLWFVLNASCCMHFVLLTASRSLHHHVAYFLKAKLWEWAFILWFTYQYPVISCLFTWQMQQFALTGDATEMVMFVLDNKPVVAPASCWHKN